MVPDLSRAILNITEGCEGFQIQKKWFGDATPPPEYGSPDTDTVRLSLQSFKGLFIVNGFALCIMLVINLPEFIRVKCTELRNLSLQRAHNSGEIANDNEPQQSQNNTEPAEPLQIERETN